MKNLGTGFFANQTWTLTIALISARGQIVTISYDFAGVSNVGLYKVTLLLVIFREMLLNIELNNKYLLVFLEKIELK